MPTDERLTCSITTRAIVSPMSRAMGITALSRAASIGLISLPAWLYSSSCPETTRLSNSSMLGSAIGSTIFRVSTSSRSQSSAGWMSTNPATGTTGGVRAASAFSRGEPSRKRLRLSAIGGRGGASAGWRARSAVATEWLPCVR
jgi:hypothetical protein